MAGVLASLRAEIAARPERLLFATLAGEHLYGMGAELDVRACHVLPAPEVLGLRAPQESIASTVQRDDLAYEYLSHDLKKFALLLLKKNGNVLEHVCSPHIVHAAPEHEELREIALACAHRNMATHFAGHARMQWEFAHGDGAPRTLGVLLALRALLAGIHLMRSGLVESRLMPLAEAEGVRGAGEWLERRTQEGRDARLTTSEAPHAAAEYERLAATLERARSDSPLPPFAPDSARDRLDALLIRLRLNPAP